MKQIELPLPPTLEEQDRIVKWVNSNLCTFDKAITQSERQIALLKEYRTRLSSDVVSGKVDVREAARRLPAEEIVQEEEVDVLEDVDLSEELAEV
jgi:type I restriction enzyme, S subunit